MANNYRYKVKTGEDKYIIGVLSDGDGAEVDLDGKDVFFTMTRNGTIVIDREDATPDPDQTANKGKVSYLLTSAVTSELAAGEYDGEFAVVDEMGLINFYPNDFTAERDFIKVVVSQSKAVPV